MLDKNLHKSKKEAIESRKFFKPRLVWILIAILAISPCLIFSVVLGYQYVFQLPKAKEAQAQLELEFKAIEPLPDSKIMKYDSSSKMTQAFVGAAYFTDTSFTEIFKYYDEQLKRQGWQLKSADGLGGKAADYCKGGYFAELQYSGLKTNDSWTYGLSMSWGLHDCR